MGHTGWTHDPGTVARGIDGHFGPELHRFVLAHYHQGQSTLPRLVTLLRSLGVSISKRQVQRLLTENMMASRGSPGCSARRACNRAVVSVDDTGARHAGKNGFCTQSAMTGSHGSARGHRRAG